MGQVNRLTEEFMNHRQILVSYVVGILKSARDAEDIVQETYLRLVQSRSNEKILFPKAYLFRVARNVTLDHLRRKKRYNIALVSFKSEADHAPATPSPEEWLIADEQLSLLGDAILKLPKRCQQVYTLCKVYGMSHREIANELSISVRTVENHVATATKLCRRHIAENSGNDKGRATVPLSHSVSGSRK